jgi:hypothetical protein
MDGCFTAEQAVLAAYYYGRAALEAKLIKGMVATVGESSSLRCWYCYYKWHFMSAAETLTSG